MNKFIEDSFGATYCSSQELDFVIPREARQKAERSKLKLIIVSFRFSPRGFETQVNQAYSHVVACTCNDVIQRRT